MAIFNEIGIGRWNRFIQKLTDMKGGPPARQLASEIVFQHPIFSGAENRYLESWALFATLTTIPAAGAGNAGFFRLRNPTGSNVIAVVTFVLPFPNASTFTDTFLTQFGPATVDLAANLASAAALDSRGPVARSTLITSTNAAGAAGTGLANGAVQTGFVVSGAGVQLISHVDQEIPVLPGQAFGVVNNTANQVYNVSMMWRERFLEPAERF